MLRTIVLFLIFFVLVLAISVQSAHAIVNPKEKVNNQFGVHILFPEEIKDASKLVNSSGGDWGYVVIPIQSGDKDLEKWQNFMDLARENHLIPIIRVSTEGDYFRTDVWRKADEADILDFANFLHSLDWPTKNRYVVILNEHNRFDEWGGEAPNPKEYADLLNYAVDIFKKRSEDFFVIMGGLDNASPNDGVQYQDNLSYLRAMGNYKSEVFIKIDGFASHSYPNPGFEQSPNFTGKSGIRGYRNEMAIINSYREDEIPVFITETGWDRTKLSDETIASYFATAYTSIWTDDNIISAAPFLLHAGPPFAQFSLIDQSSPNEIYTSIEHIKKPKGEPELSVHPKDAEQNIQAKEKLFSYNTLDTGGSYSPFLTLYFKTLLGI